MTTTNDPYRVLGIMPGADVETIHAAFRARARELHPDVTRSGDPAAFRALVEARDQLVNPAGAERIRAETNAAGRFRPPPQTAPPSFGETFAEAQQARWEQARSGAVRDGAERHAQRTERGGPAEQQDARGEDKTERSDGGAASPSTTGGVWTLRRDLLGYGGLGFLVLAGAEVVSGHAAAWAVAELLLIVVTVWTAAGRPDRLPSGLRIDRREG